MAITKLVADSLGAGATPNQSAFKNIIINGDMSIAQRSTSVSGIANGNGGYHTCDRWKYIETGDTSVVFTQSQSTDVPTGQGFAKSLKLDCTTADASPGASDTLRIAHCIEGQNLQYLKKGTSSAESTTVSFWVKATKTGTYIVQLKDKDNGNRFVSKAYTVSSSDTWEKKTLTFPGDTTGALDNDNAKSLEVNFILLAGSDSTSGTLQETWGTLTTANQFVGQVNTFDSTSNNWYITGVQWETGTSASDFEFLPVDVNLKRCERYYQKSFAYGTAPADNLQKFEYHHIHPYSGSSWAGVMSFYKTEMRTIPTVTIYTTGQSANGTGKISFYNNSSWTNGSVTVQDGSTEKFFHLTGSHSNIVLAQFNYEAAAEL
nr:putative carbohydrate binding domain containing protein [uncultured Mediterranean phage uvMED]